MGKQARLKAIKRALRKCVTSGDVTAENANDIYREAKGRTAPTPGPWPMELSADGKRLHPVPRHRVWRGDYAK